MQRVDIIHITFLSSNLDIQLHAQIQKFCRGGGGGGGGGVNFLFSLMRGKRVQIPLEAGHHWPPVVFRWRADDGPKLNAVLVAL